VRGLLDGVTVAMSVMAAALPVFLFALVPGEGRLGGAGGGTTVMTVRGSAESVEARLVAGRLRSPCCGAVLARWGWARPRVVAMFTGPEECCPRRGRCRCGRTHVLLPADLWSRRRYGAAVIMAVLVLAATAAVAGRVPARPWLRTPGGGRCLVPASTAWSWRSRFSGRAAALRQALMALLPAAAGPEAARALVPAGSPEGDCLAALEAVTAGLRRFGGLAAVAAHEVAAHLTGGRWLAPAVPAVRFDTGLDAAVGIAPW